MSTRAKYLICSLFLLFFVAGCKPECEEHEYATFDILLDSPPFNEMVGYEDPLLFDWHHNESCEPLSYRVTIKDLANGVSKHYGGAFDDTEMTFPNNQAWDEFHFQPNHEYEWSVVAASLGMQSISPPSDTWKFRTDGLCSPGSLQQPILHLPADGAWVNNASKPTKTRLIWEYPDTECWPEYYHYVLASDPGFTNIITSGISYPTYGNTWSSTANKLGLYDKNFEELWVDTPQCARIYWRVEARIGSQESGGYSETFRFTKAADFSCWQNQQSIDASIIKGYVWADYCGATVPYVPDGVGIAPPCVFGEHYGVHANGIRARVAIENEMTGVDDPAEVGIPGVVVDLGAGPCPSTGLDQFTTTERGNYFFMVQSPGEYCVSIDKANNPSLDHGIWTLPLTDQDVTGATITFNQGDDILMQNFGWDQNDFMQIEFFLDKLSVCRFGPRPDYYEVAYLNPGVTIPVFARNEDATWFATFVDGKRCFISIASGEPKEDPKDLMIFPKQPEPIIPDIPPVPRTHTCSDYKTEEDCMNNGCDWAFASFGPGSCKDP